MTLFTYLLLDSEHFIRTYFCHELREGEFKSRSGGNWGPGVGQHAYVLVHIPTGRAWPFCRWCTRQLETGTSRNIFQCAAPCRHEAEVGLQQLQSSLHRGQCFATLPKELRRHQGLPFKTGASPPTMHKLMVSWQVLITKLFLIALPLSIWLQWVHEQGGTGRLPVSLPVLLFPP